MEIIWMVIIGLIVGVIARFILPGRQPMGWILTAVLGIVGSVLAGFAGRALGLYTAGEPAGFIAAVIGAVIVLIIYGMVARKT